MGFDTEENLGIRTYFTKHEKARASLVDRKQGLLA